MARVVRSPQAELDVLAIWAHIAADSLLDADRWIDRLDECLMLWATQPHMGRARDELSPGLRSFPFGRYMVFITAFPDGIDVVRVLHSALDVDARQFP